MEGPRTLEQGRPIQRHTVHILVTPTSLLYIEIAPLFSVANAKQEI
jgi:hypothetical protein